MTSNNLISSVTCARSTSFGNLYLLKLNETLATPYTTSGSGIFGWMLWNFLIFLSVGRIHDQKYIQERVDLKKIVTFEQFDFLLTIFCVLVSISAQNSFSLDAFSPQTDSES